MVEGCGAQLFCVFIALLQPLVPQHRPVLLPCSILSKLHGILVIRKLLLVLHCPSAQQEFDQLFADRSTSSRHPEDEQQHRSDDDGSDDAREQFFEKDDDLDDLDDLDDVELKMRSRYFLPRMRHEANTGPKGVIADAQSFEQAKKSQRFSLFRRDKDSPQVDNLSVKSGDDDESFMDRWRRNRLAELQDPDSRIRSRSRGTSPGKRVFGSLVTVDAEGYLDAVEYTPENITVIVYIYDDNSETSEMVQECVQELAQMYQHTRFIRLHYEEAEFTSEGVPSLLAYRGGEKFADMVSVMSEMPDDAEMTPITLETVMLKKQMLN